MNRKNCPTEREFLELLNGQIGETEAAAALNHLEECSACEETIRKLESSEGTNKQLDPYPPTVDDACEQAIRRLKQPAIEETEFIHEIESNQIGAYQLEGEIGRGGMGVVYRATHTHLDKLVAIKLLPIRSANDADAQARFQREMKAVGRLEHQNIVRALDAGQVNGQSYLAMEIVDGLDIGTLLKQTGPLAIADACEIIRQAAMGMQYAHSRGLVHRDLKPSNLMLAAVDDGSDEPSAVVKILDMGLALLDDRDDELTTPGQIMGTLQYVAPEQITNTSEVDIRADIYSLGATLYKLLCGQTPLSLSSAEQTPLQKLAAIQSQQPEPLENLRNDMPASLANFILQMLAKSPADRPATPALVAEQLAQFSQDANLAILLDANPSQSAPANLLDPATQPRVTARRKSTKRWLLAASALPIAILLAVVIVIQTDRGNVTIQADPEWANDLKVTVLRDGEPIIEGWHIQSGEETRTIRSGKIEVVLPANLRDKLVVKQNGGQLVLRRGKQLVFTIERADTTSVRQSSVTQTKQPNSADGSAWSPDLPTDGWLPRLSMLHPDRVEGDQADRVHVLEELVEVDARDTLVTIGFPLPEERAARIGSRFAVRARFEIFNPVVPTANFMVEARGDSPRGWKSPFAKPADGSLRWFISSASEFPGGRSYKRKYVEPMDPTQITLETVFLGDELQTRLDGKSMVAERSHAMNGPLGGVLHVTNWHVRILQFDVRPLSDDEAKVLKELPSAPEYLPVEFSPKSWLEFDGVDDYVKGPILDAKLDQFTVEAWYMVPALPDSGEWGTILYWRNRVAMRLNEWGLVGTCRPVGQPGRKLVNSSRIHDFAPRHLALTFDGKEPRLFLDGFLKANLMTDSEAQVKNLESPLLSLGVSLYNDRKFRHLKGRIYNLRISKAAIYTRDFAPPTSFVKDDNTIVLFNFDEGEGDTLHDASGNEYHAEIHGARWGKPTPGDR